MSSETRLTRVHDWFFGPAVPKRTARPPPPLTQACRRWKFAEYFRSAISFSGLACPFPETGGAPSSTTTHCLTLELEISRARTLVQFCQAGQLSRRTVIPLSIQAMLRLAFHQDFRNPKPMTGMNAILRRQSGGVTAVINATGLRRYRGSAQTSQTRSKNVYAGRNGIIGAFDRRHDRPQIASPQRRLRGLKYIAGRCIRFSARYKLKSLDENRAEYERLVEVFRAHNIGLFSSTTAATIRWTQRTRFPRSAAGWDSR